MERTGVSLSVCSPCALPEVVARSLPTNAVSWTSLMLSSWFSSHLSVPPLRSLLGGAFLFCPASQRFVLGFLCVITFLSSPRSNWEISSESVTSLNTITSCQAHFLGSRSPHLRPSTRVFKFPLSKWSTASVSFSAALPLFLLHPLQGRAAPTTQAPKPPLPQPSGF